MSPEIVIFTIAAYVAALFAVAFIAGRRVDNAGYFSGNRRMPWLATATATVSAAMSGVTFISVPGSVAMSNFSYMQMVVGFIIGYMVIAFVLVPLYYRLNVTSLYEYLASRFGEQSHCTGAWFFLISRTLLSALRAYVACTVLQLILFEPLGIPFAANAVVFMLLIWLYAHRGGVRTIVWTDILRTIVLVGSLGLSIILIIKAEGLSLSESIAAVTDHPFSKTWFTEDWNDSRHIVKQLLAGIFMVIAMTGLDQDMMQHTLSCRTRSDAQKNLVVGVMLQSLVIVLFLFLGVLLYTHLESIGIVPAEGMQFPMVNADGSAVILKPDHVFPFVATGGTLPLIVGILFVLGLIASTYSAAGSALTALTTSFTIDILQGKERYSDEQLTVVRKRVTLSAAAILTILIILFDNLSNRSIIDTFYSVASYTYGPLLGLFAFGICTRRAVRDKWVAVVAVAAPLVSWLLDHYSETLFGGYRFGFEILIINALLTMAGLAIISKKRD